MPFTSYARMHPIDMFALVDSALPAQWIGFVALGAVALLTAVSIAFVLTEIRSTRETR
jgi:hypothetical protein